MSPYGLWKRRPRLFSRRRRSLGLWQDPRRGHGEVVLQYLSGNGHGRIRALAAPLYQDDQGDFRVLDRGEGGEPGVSRQVALTVTVWIAIFVLIGKVLGGARLSGHRNPGQIGIHSRAPFHGGSHPLPHEGQILLRNRDLADDFRGEGAERAPLGIGHLVDDLRPVEGATIGHGGSGVQYLQRRGQEEALADSHVVGVARDPYFGIGQPLPFAAGDQAHVFPRQVNACPFAKAKEVSIVGQTFQAQALKVSKASAQYVEIEVTGLGEAADEINGAVLTPFTNPAVKGLSLLWIIREVFVGQPESPLASELRLGGYDTLLQSGGGGNDLESRAWRI